MIYIFKTPFVLSNGSLLKPGDTCFVDNIESDDEITQEVKKRLEDDKKAKPKKKDEETLTN